MTTKKPRAKRAAFRAQKKTLEARAKLPRRSTQPSLSEKRYSEMMDNTPLGPATIARAKTWSRPAKGDKNDARCAFVASAADEHHHKLGAGLDSNGDADEDWCYGCEHYICTNCDETEIATGGPHEVADHEDLSS